MVEIRQLLIEKERVAVLARYQVRSPGGENGVCDVAEFLTVRDGKIVSSAIFFDTGALAALMSR
jgi:ketosteroid isomerase-like protein